MAERKAGRKRTGTLYWRESGWRARVWRDVDGVMLRQSVDLKTKNKRAAQAKLARLNAGAGAVSEPEAQRGETFAEAAKRVLDESSMRSKANRVGRIKNHVLPHIGKKPVGDITAADVRGVLRAMAAKGMGRGVCGCVRNDIGAVLGDLWRDEILPENVVARVTVPKEARQDLRERAVLTDAELVTYLGWAHPDPAHAGAVLERQTMSCISRMFGGVRIGDIRALKWENFEIAGGLFPSGRAPRQKTERSQLLEVPEMLRPILRDWWERAGRPTEGPVFTNRRGDRAGAAKGRSNHAAALRRDLQRAMGIYEPVVTPCKTKGTIREARFGWRKVRDLTPREAELFEPTQYTRPVDFHSFRRAYKQALADAGVDLQTSMALSGATDVKAHQRYLANTSQARRLPEAALPRIGTARAQTTPADSPKRGWAYLDLNQGLQPCEDWSEAGAEAQLTEIVDGDLGDGGQFAPEIPRRANSPCLNSIRLERLERLAELDPEARPALAMCRCLQAAYAGDCDAMDEQLLVAARELGVVA